MIPRFHRIDRVRREIGDVFTIEISPADGARPVGFAPGQFNMLYAFGTALAFVSPWISYALYVTVSVMWFVPDRRFARAL